MNRAAVGMLVLCALFLISGPAVAETFSHEEGGIEFEVPNGWEVQVDDEVLTLSTPDGTVVFSFWVPEADTWEAAVDAMFEEIQNLVENPDIKHQGDTELNGMPVYEVSGTGLVNEIPTEWAFNLIIAKKPVILLVLSNPKVWEQNRPVVKKFAESIRKTD